MNTNKDHINDDLLVKYMLGITTPAEQEEITAWIAADPAHQQYYEHFRLIWEQSKKLAAVSTVNEDDAWQRFQQRVGASEQQSEARIIKPNFSYWRRNLSIAATLLVLLGATGFWYMKTQQQHVIYANNSVTQNVLPDGSQVTLNKQSSVSYAGSFNKDRQVKLEGEAFFNVAQDPGHPFVIRVNDVTVKVLGTSFNIKSANGKTEVIVESGSVEVSKHQNSIQLQKNEKAVVTDNDAAPVKQQNTDDLYNYYRTKSFVCNNTPLWKLVAILNEAYGVNIVIADNDKREQPISVTFSNSSLDSTLQIIGITYGITIEKNGSNITLK
ncbi:FecR domain-containing protein [Chitinophaga flava]|uniref:Iron dicitrate transport regulator FecR n=1 Tax=Chitinophaga flava TaxID=2259036 RepID=A0A365XRP3_9BACT|nr:FecR domain-containing protein [Chitinophaga flava]RBL88808.1 iron dicitrate transport regulator FecR [Chitinophaga flava]